MSNPSSIQERISLHIPHESDVICYDIIIGSELLGQLASIASFDEHSKVLLLVDDKLVAQIKPVLSPLLNERCLLHPVSCGEKNKDFKNLESLLHVFHQHRLDRRSLVVNIGGGMLGDFAGFAASIYMRGLRFIQVPTTLLSQVDASVGGKVAINFAGTKNLVGAFQQPKLVLIDVDFLSTLPKQELYSGFAEIIKHALIFDREFLVELEKQKVDSLSSEQLVRIIHRSCEIKANIVQKDPHEHGLRKILNCGHTIGHAIESCAAEGSTPLLHGECVALGIVAEAALAKSRGMLQAEDCARISNILSLYHLPVRLTQNISADAMIEKMRHDKKNASGNISFALLSGIGSCETATSASEDEIRSALKTIAQ